MCTVLLSSWCGSESVELRVCNFRVVFDVRVATPPKMARGKVKNECIELYITTLEQGSHQFRVRKE